jgi:hypothetical protein
MARRPVTPISRASTITIIGTAQHDHDHRNGPQRHPAERDEDNHRGHDEQLVRERIHELADPRHHVPVPRQPAVEEIRECDREEEDPEEQAPGPAGEEEEQQQERSGDDPSDCHRVGGVPELLLVPGAHAHGGVSGNLHRSVGTD